MGGRVVTADEERQLERLKELAKADDPGAGLLRFIDDAAYATTGKSATPEQLRFLVEKYRRVLERLEAEATLREARVAGTIGVS